MMRSIRPQYLVWGSDRRFFYNSAFVPVMGVKHPSGFGQPMADVWAEVWAEIEPLVESCINEGKSYFFEDRPFVLRRHEYDELTFFSFSYTALQDDNEHFAGLMCVLMERTEEKAAEDRVRAELHRLLQLFEQAPGFICVTQGPEHTITLVNAAYERLLGRPRKLLLGRKISEDQPEVIAQGYIALLDRAYASGRPFVGRAMPVRLRRGSGLVEEVVYVDFVYQPILGDVGNVSGILVEGSDVTDRIRAEADLRASEQALRHSNINKDQFLALLGHELRNPLSPIHTATQLLKVIVGENAKAMKCVEVIERQALHMSAMVEDLFDVARVSSGRVVLKRERVDLNNIVDAALEQMRPKIVEREHVVEVRHAEGPAWVDGDQVRLTQVVCNLVANSVRYTPPGGTIRVTVAQDENFVTVAVEDNGIGISPDLIPELFELFAQANPSADRSEGGLGLGLPLVKALVEAHGGTVTPISDGIGKGSKFVVRLKRKRVDIGTDATKDQTLL